MSNYRRHYQKGGLYFFTVVTWNWQPIFHEIKNVEMLRQTFRSVIARRPFTVDAIVVLPDHLHCIWQLPEEDNNYSTRWMLIKKQVSSQLRVTANRRREKPVWQRRFWEHMIRDEADRQRHMDYIYYNPVKHGYVRSPGKWGNSSFSRAVAQGLYDRQWGAYEPTTITGLEYE